MRKIPVQAFEAKRFLYKNSVQKNSCAEFGAKYSCPSNRCKKVSVQVPIDWLPTVFEIVIGIEQRQKCVCAKKEIGIETEAKLP